MPKTGKARQPNSEAKISFQASNISVRYPSTSAFHGIPISRNLQSEVKRYQKPVTPTRILASQAIFNIHVKAYTLSLDFC